MYLVASGRERSQMIFSHSKTVANDQKLTQTVTTGRKWSQIVANGRKRRKRLQSVASRRKKSQTVGNGHARSETVANSRKRLKLVANGRKRSRMVTHGRKSSQMATKSRKYHKCRNCRKSRAKNEKIRPNFITVTCHSSMYVRVVLYNSCVCLLYLVVFRFLAKKIDNLFSCCSWRVNLTRHVCLHITNTYLINFSFNKF